MKKIILAVLLSVLAGCGEEDDYSATAYVMCESQIERQLISPSTADFPPSSDKVKKNIKAHKYTVVSHVDAQNAFGAKLRRNWSCEAEYSDGDKYDINNWKVKAKLEE